MNINISKKGPLKGKIIPPPDKSISHRIVFFASLAEGESNIKNFLIAHDPLSTVNILRSLGIEIEINTRQKEIIIKGKGLHGLKEPEDVLNCENSGTTIRLSAGLLAGQNFFSVLTGDASLRRRPLKRVITPLRMMGAKLKARAEDTLAPLAIKGGNLKGIYYKTPIASAQVKSSIILAALYAEGKTIIEEPFKSRDHTERILPTMGADIRTDGLKITVNPIEKLNPIEMNIPADFSSAAFFIVAAVIVPGSELLIENVGINPTRTGLLNILKRMGADIEIMNKRVIYGEPVADLLCRYSGTLIATNVFSEEIPKSIDEFPILAVAATQAEGITTIRGASELRVKESDRISSIVTELRKMGVEIEEYPDGMSIKGPVKLKGKKLKTYGDHRIAMALSVAALVASDITAIEDYSSVKISYPNFYEDIDKITR